MHYGFFGEYKHTLDNKNRVIVPSRFREVFGPDEEPGFFATRGLDRCLFLYPPSEWKNVVASIQNAGFSSEKARAFQRMFFSMASHCPLDRQGRMLIPANLLGPAEIRSDVVLAGVSERIEIWDVENWKRYCDSKQESYEDACSEIF